MCFSGQPVPYCQGFNSFIDCFLVNLLYRSCIVSVVSIATDANITKENKENKENENDCVKQLSPEKKARPRHIQPTGTMRYNIEVSDTLQSIAAKFDTTPSEVKKLNKLFSTIVFPGQVRN